MKNLSVLIVDDSTDFSSSLKRVFENMGWEADTAAEEEQASKLFKEKSHDLVLVDCFMPGTDGFTISKNLSDIKEQNKLDSIFFLMSGILIDASSKKEALSYSHIQGFVSKPIDSTKFQNDLNKFFPSDQASPIKIFTNKNLKMHSALEELKNITSVQNYESVFILKQLSEQEFSGTVKFTTDSFETLVSFYNGQITSVFNSNFEDSLGEILVKMGYLTRDNLSLYISSEDFKDPNLRIGEALIKRNYISPHSIPIALKEQKKLRIQKILSDDGSFDFSVEEDADYEGSLESSLNLHEVEQTLVNLIEDLPEKTFGVKLAKSLSDFNLELGSQQAESSTGPSKQEIQTLIESKNKGLPLDSKEIKVMTTLLLQRSLDLVSFADDLDNSSPSEKNLIRQRVQYLAQKVKLKSPYEILNLSSDSITDQKISKKYQSIAKELHPDKLSRILNAEEQEKASQIFAEFTKAFNSIKTAEARKAFESFKVNQNTQDQLNCNADLELAKQSLQSGEYTKALKILDTELMHKYQPNEFGLYFLWAALKNKDYVLNRDANKILEKEMKDLKSEALYYYLKAVLAFKASEDLESFEKFINLSLKADPQFLPSRRELQIVRSHLQSTKKQKSSWFSFKKSS